MVGAGRMAEPEAIADAVLHALGRRHDLAGEVVLVTAGGTREALDPVRFLGNRSSGKMGYALADAAQSRGAKVILISGPSALASAGALRSGQGHHGGTDAARRCLSAWPRPRWSSRPLRLRIIGRSWSSDQKLKRTGPMTLELAPTEDILAEVCDRRRPGQLIIGFAAETENPMENGRAKLLRKGADAIVVNAVSGEGVGIEADTQCGNISDARPPRLNCREMPKRKLADRILDEILTLRRPRPLVLEFDERSDLSPQDEMLQDDR